MAAEIGKKKIELDFVSDKVILHLSSSLRDCRLFIYFHNNTQIKL